ncbi:MAG: primase protein [Candidatus Moranbacteria bacterium GW2011_GWC2_37_73]|nr:MAG: primase protein [Parcubacteria group bacterium GW2011_GWC1_36_108]KKQ39969.1 MAG: primase protein [Candidatus Moranbacteria bacterium GW2011_GWC2_37_73]
MEKGGIMFDDNRYPDYVQIEFEKYFKRLREELTWNMVLPKYFRKDQLKKAHEAIYVRCSFHKERTASMRFSFSRNIFHCYGCGSGGSLFSFISKKEGGAFEAMLFIRKHFQILLPFSRKQWRAIKTEMAMMETLGLNSDFQAIALDGWGESYVLEDEDWEEIETERLNFELSCIDPVEAFFDLRDDCFFHPTTQIKEVKKVNVQKKEEQILLDVSGLRLEKFIIIRHGMYGFDDRLNERGRQQMEELSKKIDPLLKGGKSSLLISSTAPRALDSADVLEEKLFFKRREDLELFWSDNSHNWDITAAIEVILEKGIDYEVVIIVSHLEYCEYLPWRFMKKVFGLDSQSFSMNKGDACMCNLVEKTLIKL